jgi:hypothetical protein
LGFRCWCSEGDSLVTGGSSAGIGHGGNQGTTREKKGKGPQGEGAAHNKRNPRQKQQSPARSQSQRPISDSSALDPVSI